MKSTRAVSSSVCFGFAIPSLSVEHKSTIKKWVSNFLKIDYFLRRQFVQMIAGTSRVQGIFQKFIKITDGQERTVI